jgi:hypothetical protein
LIQDEHLTRDDLNYAKIMLTRRLEDIYVQLATSLTNYVISKPQALAVS